MKKETIFKKADELYDSILPTQRKVREYSEKYIKKALEENGGRIDFECDDCISVSYDGGNHPEYASNCFSTVYSVFMGKDGIYLSIEDCDKYPIENLNWDEVYNVADCIKRHYYE